MRKLEEELIYASFDHGLEAACPRVDSNNHNLMGDYSDQFRDQRNPKFWAFRRSNQVSYDLVLPFSGATQGNLNGFSIYHLAVQQSIKP